MAISWITPVTDRSLADITKLKETIERIRIVGWDDESEQNISDKWYWLYGDEFIYVLNSSDAILMSADGYQFITHGEQQSIKGAWNYIDANRIINNSIYLRDLMNTYGYNVDFPDQPYLTILDIPYFSEVNLTYKQNIQKLLDAFYPFDHPTIDMSNIYPIYIGANNMEICLELLHDILSDMLKKFLFSGEFNCGDDIVL